MSFKIKIDENYYLIKQYIQSNTVVDVVKKTNHIYIVDVSGSMSGDLSLIRKQLKNKLSNIMNDGDTITIIWFSGRNDCGILKEEVEVKSLKTLSDLNDSIDKWLKPIGLTAFLKPLELTKDVIDRIRKNRPDSVFSLMFLTDGYNNDSAWDDVVKSLKKIENEFAAATFIEYGYYADSKKLTEMAGILGGEKISTSDFDDFEPIFDSKISSPLKSGKKIIVDIQNYLYDFAFSITSTGVVLYNITDNKISVNSDVTDIYYFSSSSSFLDSKFDSDVLYAAIYVLSDRLLYDDAEKIFYILGDNFYYRELLNAFGKQKLNTFKTNIKECITNPLKRFPLGVSEIKKVPNNTYCLMNLMEDLTKSNCLFYPSHPSFKYNRIGRKKIQKGNILSEENKNRLSNASTINEAQEIIDELMNKKIDLKFISTEEGYSLNDLVWNEERANLSIRIKINGVVSLPSNKFGIENIQTYKYNTFTIIKDGIVNISELPVSFSTELINILNENHVDYLLENSYIIIKLNSIPIINKSMIEEISAVNLANQEWELLKLQADKKVYDYFRKSLYPKESTTFIELYGQECADWLKEIGITDFNGFSPKTESEESTDFYMSVNLITKFKGLSGLPKVEDVIKKLAKNDSLKINEWILSGAILDYQSQLNSDLYKSLNENQQKDILKTYLINKTDTLNRKKRATMQKIAETKFSIILSKKWFKEFSSFDENKMTLNLNTQNVDVTFDLVEKEVKI
jgi:hypothetical protein